jgi:hypothetical protein
MTAHHTKTLRTLELMQLPLMLVVAAILFVALPADAGNTPCSVPVELERGDHLRLLRVWACGYTNDSGVAERGRIVMRTYRKTREGWLAVTSQFITLEDAHLYDLDSPDSGVAFGQIRGGNCRVGSPAGSLGCSVPNTDEVTFYGPAWDRPAGHDMQTVSYSVSWRDDQGFPHAHRPAWAKSYEWDAK